MYWSELTTMILIKLETADSKHTDVDSEFYWVNPDHIVYVGVVKNAAHPNRPPRREIYLSGYHEHKVLWIAETVENLRALGIGVEESAAIGPVSRSALPSSTITR
jgi:hypothetical protein